MRTQLHRTVYYKDENFTFEFERINEYVLIHCECWNWKVSVAKKMYEVFHTFLEEIKQTEETIKVMTISPNPKFCMMFGGKAISTIVDFKGNNHEVIVWE